MAELSQINMTGFAAIVIYQLCLMSTRKLPSTRIQIAVSNANPLEAPAKFLLAVPFYLSQMNTPTSVNVSQDPRIQALIFYFEIILNVIGVTIIC